MICQTGIPTRGPMNLQSGALPTKIYGASIRNGLTVTYTDSSFFSQSFNKQTFVLSGRGVNKLTWLKDDYDDYLIYDLPVSDAVKSFADNSGTVPELSLIRVTPLTLT